VTLGHASPLKKLDCVLSLGQEQPVGGVLDGDVEEVMEIPKICHGELGVEPIDDALKECWRGGGEDDVVDVQQQVGKTSTLFVHKEGETSEADRVNPSWRMYMAKRWYHARGACFRP
jgi:hypothetical protein